MKEPFYPEGFELFECPECEASIVKYRFDYDPNGDVVHWAECDFSMCRKHHELHYPDVKPENPSSLMIVESLTREQIMREIFKRDPLIKKASDRLKELSEDPEFIVEFLKWEEQFRER
ncbi:hypothetical protein K7887_07585 [Sutcliffiella horikoshii]|uniref:hypothetical protein n=1 Tax=Sutcliffiella horikoshii TaxID=79883 RepID=UPI001CBEC1AD|nr:hypothetical protein [Sutcliffiella horikoshii]UAL48782.1 hypothetical protein K7887_07585 [Sutcliffiella horikoshii]